MNIRVEELDRAAIGRAGLVWTTGVGLSDEPSRTATLAVLESATGVRVHDLDHRPVLWRSTEDARRWAREAAKRATVVVGNEDEVEMATATRDADRAMDALLGIGPELVVVKRGGEGAVARRGDERVAVPGVRVDVLCGLGAGDAFGAALCHGLLARWPLARVLAFANAAGAIVASRLACADAMPTEAEVDAILARSVT
jgi:5-dehydro-2-deoxygluconokinase